MTDDTEDGNMEEKAKMAEKVVRTTLDFFAIAKHIIEEQHKVDGDQYDPDNEPSLQELVCVSQLIMNGSMAGVYRDAEQGKKTVPVSNPDSIIRAVVDGITPIIDSKIRLALLKAGPQPMPMPRPVPMPSIYERVMDKIYSDLKGCNCIAKSADCELCETCAKLTTTVEVFHAYMDKETRG